MRRLEAQRGRMTATLGALLVGLLVIVGCSAKVDSTTTKGSTVDSADTSSGGGASKEITKKDLEGLLPNVEDLSSDYSKSDSGEDDSDSAGDVDPVTAEIEKECPDLDALEDLDKGPVTAERDFRADDGREIDVALAKSTPADADKRLADVLQGISTCRPMTVTDAGTTYKISFDGEENSDNGDKGVEVTMHVTYSAKSMSRPIDVEIHARMLRVGDVVVMVSATSGYNDAAATEVDADVALRDGLVESLARRAKDLQN